jgi:hypothetical protein
MGFLQASLVALCAVISTVSAIHINIATTVKLDNGTFIGTKSNGITKFLGIPFAKPPSVTLLWPIPCLPRLTYCTYYIPGEQYW